jgi:catechol-2,3-dioxygenase
MSAPTKFAHVVYKTHRYDEMIDWYVKVFDAKIQNKTSNLAFLSYDDEHHRIAFLNLGPRPADLAEIETGLTSKCQGVHHVSYTWATLDELLDQYLLMKENQTPPTYCLRHGLTLSMYYADPDGNGMEFQVDVLRLDDAVKFMESPEFDANPVGEPFDPEDLIKARQAKESLVPHVLRSDQTVPEAGFAIEIA